MAESDTSESTEKQFCGNCGASVLSGSKTCGQCGTFVEAESDPLSSIGDYVPYCRACGVPVAKEAALHCTKCSVAPLCQEHFYPSTRSCSLCPPVEETDGEQDQSSISDRPNGPWARPAVVVPCSQCGARIRRGVDYCPNCGTGQASSGAESKYASFLPRLAAITVDYVILFLVGAGLFEIFNMPALGILIFIPYFVGFTYQRGQTPGKILLKIMVVDSQGEIPEFKRIVFREIVIKAAPGILFLAGSYSIIFFIAGYITGVLLFMCLLWVLRDTDRRGLHDHIAGTFVANKDAIDKKTE
ncbi:MAG: RDD family protein [Dehalococcoidia bacterium]|nr:RDD family protein [Dehalococcoidia bacterium]